ncbi:MAG: beta-Ala-His dipeptidase [Acidobacteriota bacterium]
MSDIKTESSVLVDLEPTVVWRHFDALCAIPRPPRGEDRAIDYVRSWATARGFPVRADAIGNQVVSIPASPGHENAPTVVLQSHLDMVWEKDAESDHDFDRDPIPVAIEDGWVTSRGTTLGADNGIGVALSLAVGDTPELTHGPLELLFTVQEEIGLLGAAALDPDLVSGRLLVNLDGEREGYIFIGCAGGGGIEAELDMAARPVDVPTFTTLAVTGLRGGHSGVDIDSGRGNAIVVLADVLTALEAAGVKPRPSFVEAGDKANAIPRHARIELALDADALALAKEVVAAATERWRAKLGDADPQIEVSLQPASQPVSTAVWSDDATQRLIDLLSALPCGALARDPALPIMPETSANIASLRTEDGVVQLVAGCRSSIYASQERVVAEIAEQARRAGARVDVRVGYPGWQPNLDSPLVATAARLWGELHGAEPTLLAVHAGLECGVLTRCLPGLDAVSFGPDLLDPHSPRERVRIASVASMWAFLGRLLAVLATDPLPVARVEATENSS